MNFTLTEINLLKINEFQFLLDKILVSFNLLVKNF